MLSHFVGSWSTYMAAGADFVDAVLPMVLWFCAFLFGFGVVAWAVDTVQGGSYGNTSGYPSGSDARRGG